MPVHGGLRAAFWTILCFSSSGCALFSSSDVAALKEQNRTLIEKSRADAAQLLNLQVHIRDLEDRLKGTEEELARVNQRAAIERRQPESVQPQRQ